MFCVNATLPVGGQPDRCETTEGEDKYVLSVGDIGETTYTFDEIQVGPTLSLG